MKNTIKQTFIKVISMILIIFLTVPSQIFASSLFRKNDKTYDGTQSIMGIASSNGTNDLLVGQGEESEQAINQSDKSITENEYYIIEKSANYSKARGLVTYRIAISPKTTDDPNSIVKAVFAINSNTKQSDLKVDGVATVENGHEVETKFKEEKPSFLSADSNIDSLSIETEQTNQSLVYYISTKLEDSELSSEHTLALDLAFLNQENKSLVQDRCIVKKDSENNLVEDENASLIDGTYTAKTSSLLGQNPATITWTDYIFSKTEKEFIYQINLDESQDVTNAEIHLDFYQARENGFILDKAFSQDIPFTKELKLQIPQGYIVRLEVKTNEKENANPQKFTYNNKEIENPNYKEEEQNAKDEDPLPDKSSNKDAGSNSSNNIISDQKDLDFSRNSKTKKEEQTTDKSLNKDAGSNSSNNIISDQKDLDFSTNSNTKKEEQTADKFLNTDAGSKSSNDIIAYEKDQDFSTNSKAENAEIPTSAITLNRDAYISKLEDEKRLTSELKKVTNQLTYLLESYSKEELSLEDLKSKLKYIAQAENIAPRQAQEIITALIAGLNEDKFKAASLDPSKLVYDAIEKDQVQTAVAGPEAKLPEKTPDKLAAEKLAEDGITIEDFQNYMYELEEKYNLTNEDADRIYTANADAIGALVAKAQEEKTTGDVFAVEEGGSLTEDFVTMLNFEAQQLSAYSNVNKLYDIARSYYNDNGSNDDIFNKYVGWQIHIKGDNLKKLRNDGKYDFSSLDIALYAPADQSLVNYRVVVEDRDTKDVIDTGIMDQTGTHMTYGMSVAKNKLPDDGFNVYVVAEAPIKRNEYTLGIRVTPDNNYVNSLVKEFEGRYEELKQKYPLLISFINTDQGDPFAYGINLIDTRLVYKEPDGIYTAFKNNPIQPKDYNDNNTDTRNKNTISVKGNLSENGDLTWTVSETVPLEKMLDKSSIGYSAYNVTRDGYRLGNPEVQLLIPEGSGYRTVNLGKVSRTYLQSNIGDEPGTIVNYKYDEKVSDLEKVYKLSIPTNGANKIASIYRKVYKPAPAYSNSDGKVQAERIKRHPDGKLGVDGRNGWEVVDNYDKTMTVFTPTNKSISPRLKDPGVASTGAVVFCLTANFLTPTIQNKFPSKAVFEKITLKNSNTEASGAQIFDGMKKPYGINEHRGTALYETGMSNSDHNKLLFEYMQRVFWYAEQMREEYKLSTDEYWKIVQYNIYVYTTGKQAAEEWHYQSSGSGHYDNIGNDVFPYALELEKRVKEGKDWDNVDRSKIHLFVYTHDTIRYRYQVVMNGYVEMTDTPDSKNGNIQIKKLDSSNNQGLSNAEFKLTNVKDNKTYTQKSNLSGVASFNDLPLGEYIIEETSAPSGYRILEQKRNITLTEDNANQTLTVTMYNSKSKIEFIKVDENSQIIPGTTFELRKNGIPLTGYDKSADSSGKFGWTGLRQGTYEVYEKSLPSGYEDYKHNLGKKVAEFTIDGQNNVSAMTNLTNSLNSKSNVIINKPIEKTGKIKIVKTNANNTEEKLQGVEFTLSPANGTSGDPLTGSTDENGELYFWDVPNGDYTLAETKAPEGFIVENWTKYIYVRNGKVTETLPTNSQTPSNNQSTTGIKVSSKDQLNASLFANISDYYAYQVKNTPTEIKFKKTFSDGGNYNVKVVENLPNADNENAYFTLKDDQGNSYHEAKYQSVSNNTITFRKLPVGRTYTLKEQIPLGFNEASEYKFEVDQNGYIKALNFNYKSGQDVNILNSKTPKAKFAIRKIDADTNLDLAGATFTLTGESLEEPIVKTTSTTENPIIFENLDVDKSYTLKETGVPVGYRDENKEYIVNIDKDGNVTIQDLNGEDREGIKTFTIANKKNPKGRFRIEKVDESNNPLDDVTFTLTANSGTDRFEKVRTTNANGVVEFTDLNPGDYTLVESEAKAGYVASKKTWNVNVGELDGLVTISPNDKFFGQNDLSDLINLPTAYAAEAGETINLVFIVENLRGKSEGVVEAFNNNIDQIKNQLADSYGDRARIILVANGHNDGQPEIYSQLVTSDADFKLNKFDEAGGNMHLDEAIQTARNSIKANPADQNNVIIMSSGKADLYLSDYAYNSDKGFFTPEDNIAKTILFVEDENANLNPYTKGNRAGNIISEGSENFITGSENVNNLTTTLAAKVPNIGLDTPIQDANISTNQRLALDDLDTLRRDGYIITNSNKYENSNISVLKVLNRKPLYPATGGSGTKIAFALIGTAIMITGLAYYGMYLSEKYRRRSSKSRA